MLKEKLFPKFSDTDALGHINNATYLQWFEGARRPIFQMFVPDLDPKKWNLILARIEIDYLAQGSYQDEITLTTSIEKIGNSSVIMHQEALQNDIQIAKSKSVMVYFDYDKNRSIPIPNDIRIKLENL